MEYVHFLISMYAKIVNEVPGLYQYHVVKPQTTGQGQQRKYLKHANVTEQSHLFYFRLTSFKAWLNLISLHPI